MAGFQIPFMEKLTKLVPDEPKLQSQYVYYLTTIVFCGLLGFAVSAWIVVFTHFDWRTLFQAIFMSAISMLSLFGVKQTRANYLMIKQIYSSGKPELKVESEEEMLKGFEEVKVEQEE